MEQEQQITVRRRVEFIGIGPHFFVRLLVCLALGGFLVWKRALLLGDGWAAPAMAGGFWLALVFLLFFRLHWRTPRREFWTNCAFVVIAAFFSYYQIEMLGFNDIIKKEIQALFINWGLILLVYLAGYVLTNRFWGAVVIGNVLCFALAVTNHLVFLFRGTPFLPNDIYATQTAMSVLGQMNYVVTRETILGVLPFLLNFAIVGQLSYKNTTRRAYWAVKIGGTVVVTALLLLCTCTDALLYCGTTISYWNTVKSCNANGEVMQLLIYIRKSQVQKPQGYSLARIEEIEAAYTGGKDPQPDGTEQKPNLIVIMNEAFSDLSVIRDFETNEDYFPFLHSLTENTIQGKMVASIKGGGTCNTEFEFLTASTQAFLPVSCLPYQQYIHAKMPSLAHIAKAQGYQVLAVHPYYATGWRRSTVYPLLGFDEFASLEDFPSYAQTGRLRLITDRANYKYLIQRYETREGDSPVFYFNVTMQNHSGYSTDYGFADRITVNDYVADGNPNEEVYLSLMRQSDAAFQYLVEYFETVEEPTIILMFGDHQPGDMKDFLDWLGRDLDDSLEDLAKLYIVPYVIWANYDIEESSMEYVSANYLSSVLMEMAGMELPAYHKFLLELREEFPVVSSKICIDSRGNYLSPEEALAQSDKLREYQLLQYNNLFDGENRSEAFFYGKSAAGEP